MVCSRVTACNFSIYFWYRPALLDRAGERRCACVGVWAGVFCLFMKKPCSKALCKGLTYCWFQSHLSDLQGFGSECVLTIGPKYPGGDRVLHLLLLCRLVCGFHVPWGHRVDVSLTIDVLAGANLASKTRNCRNPSEWRIRGRVL